MVRKITKWHLLFPYLNNYGRHLILVDFERELVSSHQMLKKYIYLLINEKIIISHREGKVKTYSLNFDNPAIYDYLSVAEKLMLEIKLKNKLLKRFYDTISRFFSESFIIFGSFAKNLKGNDLDILIIGKEGSQLSKSLKNFGEIYGLKIHKIVIPNINKLMNEALGKEIFKKHIILNNSDMFVRFFGELYDL